MYRFTQLRNLVGRRGSEPLLMNGELTNCAHFQNCLTDHQNDEHHDHIHMLSETKCGSPVYAFCQNWTTFPVKQLIWPENIKMNLDSCFEFFQPQQHILAKICARNVTAVRRLPKPPGDESTFSYFYTAVDANSITSICMAMPVYRHTRASFTVFDLTLCKGVLNKSHYTLRFGINGVDVCIYVFNDRERTDCPKKTILGRK